MLKRAMFKVASVVLVAFYSLNIMAAGCDEKSPTYVAQGDRYFDIEEVSGVTEEQKKLLRKIFSSVKRKLKGTGSSAVCFADNGVQKKQVVAEKYTADFSLQSDGAIMLSIDGEKPEQKITYNAVLAFFDSASLFVIKKITAKSVEAVSKYRAPSVGSRRGGSVLREEMVKVSAHGKGLKIVSTTYINGYFAEEYTRTFR